MPVAANPPAPLPRAAQAGEADRLAELCRECPGGGRCADQARGGSEERIAVGHAFLAFGCAQKVAEAEVEAALFDTRQDLGKGNVRIGAAGVDAPADFARQFVGDGHQVGAGRAAREAGRPASIPAPNPGREPPLSARRPAAVRKTGARLGQRRGGDSSMHAERQKLRVDPLVNAIALDAVERFVDRDLQFGTLRVDAEWLHLPTSSGAFMTVEARPSRRKSASFCSFRLEFIGPTRPPARRRRSAARRVRCWSARRLFPEPCRRA